MPLQEAAIAAGTAISVIGERNERAASQQIANVNAAQFRAQGVQETQVAREEQRRVQEEGEIRKSRLRVLAANAGISLEGTPLLQLEEVAGETERQRQFIGQRGRQRVAGLEFQARGQEAVGKRIRGRSAFRTGRTILTGLSLLT